MLKNYIKDKYYKYDKYNFFQQLYNNNKLPSTPIRNTRLREGITSMTCTF